MFQLFKSELYVVRRTWLERKRNPFQHHGQSTEQRLLSASSKMSEANQCCFVMKAGGQFIYVWWRWPNKSYGYAHFQIHVWNWVLHILLFQLKAWRKHFSLFMQLSFSRPQKMLKRTIFCRDTFILSLPTCIITVCSRWECQCCGFALPSFSTAKLSVTTVR